jgi:hypothetical protein
VNVQRGIFLGGVLVSSMSTAGPLSVESRLGLAGDYSWNPDLRADDPRSENHVALLLDAPIRYDRDDLQLSLNSSARYSNTSGYASLASNYFRVDAAAQRLNERGSIVLSGGLARDSSLYHGGESDRGIGVRRDTRSAGFNWQNTPSARTSLQFALDWTRVTYDQNARVTNLTDYRYLSWAPSLGYALTERNTMRLMGSTGRYNSLNEITGSKDYNLQLGLDRQLNEIWTMSLSYGYSKAKNSQKYYFGPFYLGTIESDQRGTVYNANLKRRGESLSLSLAASRSLRPSGFAFLSRQDVAEAVVYYQYSEKWTFAANGGFHRNVDPLTSGGDIKRRYFVAQISADWHWTPDWVVTLRTSHVGQRFDDSRLNADSSGVSLEMTRQFHRQDLN